MFRFITACLCSTFLLFSSILFSATAVETRTSVHDSYRLQGLSATVPSEVGLVVRNFTKGLRNRLAPTSPDLRRVILHGTYGVGKTEITRAVAAATDSELIELKASGVVNPFQGSGSKKIQETFSLIKQKFDEGANSVVLFIDEIDALASTDTPDNYRDMQGALRELCCSVLDFESEKRLLIFFATNDLDKIEERLLNRSTKIEVSLPDDLQRADILQSTFTRYSKPSLAVQELNFLAANIAKQCHGSTQQCASGLSVEATAEAKQIISQKESQLKIITSYNALHTTMNSFDKKIAALNLLTDSDAREKMRDTADVLMAKCTTLYEHAVKEIFLDQTHKLEELAKKHRDISLQYFSAIKQYLTKTPKMLSPQQLEYLVQETKGMPPRSLISFIRQVHVVADDTNNGIITEKIIHEELRKAQASFALEKREAAKKIAKKIDQEEEELRHKERVRADFIEEARHREKVRKDYAEEQQMRVYAYNMDTAMKHLNFYLQIVRLFEGRKTWSTSASEAKKIDQELEDYWKKFCAIPGCLECQRVKNIKK